ncbi:DUF6415 family natural product biosynthesis protein [Streptomyces sp. NPDC015125]|uniref:DUF6415 family natural product biosynthesis protein n=1 Tax=Streptomyces sp. NPDC015125 TaxID=3364938 RepID=UPI0036F4BA76
MDSPPGITPDLTHEVPVDAESISEAIRRALRLGAARPALDELTAAQEELRGHTALLLPLVRADQARLPQDSVLAHQVAARLTGIGERAGQPLRPDTLAAHAQVAGIARDVQYLLAMHTTAVRP